MSEHSDRREQMERMVGLARGPKGEKGDRGEGMTRGALRAVVILFVLTFALAAANVLWTAHLVNGAVARARTECKFNADLAGAPVTPSRAVKPSRLGVTIVSDARVAWRGLGCSGVLPPPAPSFVRWARYYHLPAN